MGQSSKYATARTLGWAAVLLAIGCASSVEDQEVPLIDLGELTSAISDPGEAHSNAHNGSRQKWRRRGAKRRHQLARHWRHQGLPIAPEHSTRHSHDAGDPEMEPSLDNVDPMDAGVAPGDDEIREQASDAGAEPLPSPEPEIDPNRDIVARSQLEVSGWADGEALTQRQVWKRLSHSRATCLGEFHDNPYHHNLQLRALRMLARKARWHHKSLAVGYEMFQRPYQQPLSDFVDGSISESEFLTQTEYAERWGWDFSFYRPLLETTGHAKLPALALNARRELTRQIGREGLESLTPELAALLPELDLQDEEHRQYIFGLFGLTPDHPSAAALEDIYTAQTTWDETMASTASDWLLGGHKRSLVMFAGVAHCHRSAIPRRLERRTGKPVLSVAPVMQSEWLADPESWEGYDLLVLLDDSNLVPTEPATEDTETPPNPHSPADSE